MSELLPARQKTHDSHWAAQRSQIASPCLLFVPRVRYVVLLSYPDAAVLKKGAVSLLLLPWGLLATSLSPFVELAVEVSQISSIIQLEINPGKRPQSECAGWSGCPAVK